MTKELLQQCLDALIESRGDVDLCYAGVKAARLSFRQERQLGFYEEQLVKHDAAIEGLKQALAQQEQCGCREGECETKKDKTCRMTIEIAERDGIPEWTPAIGIECAISSLRDDAARLRDGSYTPLQIADDLDVIANDLAKCKPDAQQEQPAQEPVVVQKRVCYESGDYSAWVEIPMSEADNQYRDCVEIRKLYTHPAPTQPAPINVDVTFSRGDVEKLPEDQCPDWCATSGDRDAKVHVHLGDAQPALSNAEVTAKGQVAFGSAWCVIGAYYHKGFRDGEAHCRGGANK